jgi:phospho-N-acetylmuramoyl-pentapeptide-transferase
MIVSRSPLQTLIGFLFSSPLITGGLSFLVALVLMLAIGRPMIAWLRNKRWRKEGESWTVREDTPDTHLKKQGTPSMGGIGIISSAILSCVSIFATLIFINQAAFPASPIPSVTVRDVLALMILPTVLLAHAGMGFTDDWSKASGRGGLRARTKIAWQIALTILFLLSCWILLIWPTVWPSTAPVFTDNPWFFYGSPSLSVLFIFGFLCVFMIGTCNAVNLTDGIDGLAAGLTVITGLSLALTAPHTTPGYGFLVFPFVMALAGACLGFLNFNKYKAQVFMGDTGSLAIGAALAAAAILLRAVWLLPFVGFMFYVEMLSVTTQVLWFKYTRKKTGEGKRLFRRAPLHHHFELGGWSEWRVVLTFWSVNLVTAIIGLILWHTGILPRFP